MESNRVQNTNTLITVSYLSFISRDTKIRYNKEKNINIR